MLKTSHNVVFVYSLLVIDLLVNITDNSLSTSVGDEDQQDINGIVFTVIIVQILAIICVIFDLVLHFFDASDQVRQFAWLQRCQSELPSRCHHQTACDLSPMPQRVAFKLILDKYWWSLLVGLSYLVLTIVLRIIRLDPSWHNNLSNHSRPVSASLLPNGGDSQNWMTSDSPLDPTTDASYESPRQDSSLSSSGRPAKSHSLLPTLILLVHKLVSTCYYVSFVVVYRASPSQMMNRILFVNSKQHSSSARMGNNNNNK